MNSVGILWEFCGNGNSLPTATLNIKGSHLINITEYINKYKYLVNFGCAFSNQVQYKFEFC